MFRIATTAILCLILLVGGTLLLGARAHESAGSIEEKQEAPAGVRVGIFDSRAIALAHYRSPAFKSRIAALHAELEKAKKAGDTKKIAELEKKGPELQALVHRQGFGTWPVDDILKKIDEQIPDIAEAAKVDLIVSRWDLVFERPGVELVDVTEALVRPFEPDAETLKIIRDIRKKDPVPLEELEKHRH